MAFVQAYNTQRKKNDADPYGGFSTTTNAGVNNTGSVSTETGLLKDTSGGKLANAQEGGSGRFVNLQNYLDANKGQAVDLSQNVGQHIGNEVSQAQTALTSAADTYKADVAKNTRTYDQNLVNNVIANPNANANAENVKKFSDVLSGTYGGPTVGSTATFDPAIKEVTEATVAGKNVNNAAGQTALLKGMSANRPYTTGGYNFNQLLLQNNDQARANITEAGKQADPLGGQLTGAFTQAADLTTQAQLNNQKVANDSRAAIAAETSRLEAKWAQDAAAIDAQKQLRSDELINKLATLGTGARVATQANAIAAEQERKMIASALSQMGEAAWKSGDGRVGEAADNALRNYQARPVSGTVSGGATVDTSAFTDQDIADLGMTRLQLNNILRSRQRVVDMGGAATDLSQWLAPYIHKTTAAGAASSADANRYNNLNSLIGAAPTQNVSQAAIDAARANKPLFDTKEAYVRMNTEMNTIQAQQQARWAKEQEIRSAQIIADAQRAAAKAAQQASYIQLAGTLIMAAAAFFSDETLKENISETSSDDITNILNDLTKGTK